MQDEVVPHLCAWRGKRAGAVRFPRYAEGKTRTGGEKKGGMNIRDKRDL